MAFDGVERGEVRRARHARIREPAPKLARLLKRLDATRARQRQRQQTIGRTVRDQRRLQRRLFAQIKREQKTDLHKKADVRCSMPDVRKESFDSGF